MTTRNDASRVDSVLAVDPSRSTPDAVASPSRPAETPPAAEPPQCAWCGIALAGSPQLSVPGTSWIACSETHAALAAKHPLAKSGGAAERAGGGTTEPWYRVQVYTDANGWLTLMEGASIAADVSEEESRVTVIETAVLTAERALRAQAEAERDALVAGIRRVLDCPCLSGASCDELDTLRATLAGGGQ